MRARLAIVAAVVLLPVGAALAYHAADGRSLAIFPRQQIPLRFDHHLHGELGMKCTDCHSVDTSHQAADRNLPGHDTCSVCHDIEAAKAGEETDPPATCTTCHPAFVPAAMKEPKPLRLPAPNLKFDHQVHLEKEIPCARCHGDVDELKLATRDQLPRMEQCLECHRDGGPASGDCKTCHLTGPSGRLAKVMPDGARLIPSAGNPFGVFHDAEYWSHHAADARAAGEVCQQCHAQSECLTCHDGARKILKIHPNDWISLHPVVAKHGRLRCTACHNEQHFCATCHERVGIGANSDPSLRATNLRVHPPTSVWVDTPGPGHHGVWASRDIGSCVACHREEECIRCHASSGRLGRGVNPHPPGFRAQACGIYSRNARVCFKCHGPTDPSIQGCQ